MGSKEPAGHMMNYPALKATEPVHAIACVNGVRLYVMLVGDERARPLLLLHGFTGSVETWAPFLPAFALQFRVIAVDLLGHGRSDAPEDPERYRMERCVEDLLALLDAYGIAQADVLGYSMGGRVALCLAVAAAERVRALVLESASPGIEDSDERRARAAADDALAEQIERDGLEVFVAAWEQQPLFATQARLPEAVRARLRIQRLHQRPLGLANSLRGMGVGRQEPLWQRLAELSMPVLVITGALDEKYCSIGQRMTACLPRARLEIVPAAGHAVHLEQPEAFIQCVLDFLSGGVP